MTSIRKKLPLAPVVSATAAQKNAAPQGNTSSARHAVDGLETSRPASPTPPNDPALTVPEGGEAMTKRDVERLTACVLELAPTAIPERLHITRAEVEARLPYLVSDVDAARIIRDNGHDILIYGDSRCQLASKPSHGGRHAPTERIAAVAKSAPADKPLRGLRIALDPGHFSGLEDMREGKFVTGGPPPSDTSTIPADGVTEGQLTVASAQNLAARLRALGADVTLTHQGVVKRTQNRADLDAHLDAHPELASRVANRASFITSIDLERRAERLSAPTPDIVIAMHFDAEQHQVNPAARREVKIYVPGAFIREDFASTQQSARFATQLQSRSWDASVALAKTMVQSICRATGAHPQLPAETGAVNPRFLRPIDATSGVFARNLRMPAAVRGEPLNLYLEGATYNHPGIYPEAFRDRDTATGVPGGFVDRYAQSIADGIVAYVASQRLQS